jgi:hypothetical protein
MPNLVLAVADLMLETRRKTSISHRMNRRAPPAGSYEEDAAYDKRYPAAHRRNVGPCNTYNCHGLTFGTRRAGIEFADVPLILEQDDYTEIDRAEVMPGDVAVYFSTGKGGTIVGDIEHSGLVVERTQLGNVKLVSKWGYGDERVHFLTDCPYDAGNVRFFRINDCPRTRQRRPFVRAKHTVRR